MQQYPHCFEFNEKLLVDILDNLYNCYFAEFLFNNERERAQAKPYALFSNTLLLVFFFFLFMWLIINQPDVHRYGKDIRKNRIVIL